MTRLSDKFRQQRGSARQSERSNDSDLNDDVSTGLKNALLDGEDDMDEAESSSFLAELEGGDAEVNDIKSLHDLIVHPHEGSLIMAFKDPKRRTKAHLIKMATDSFIPNIVPIVFSDDVPMEMYIIFRLVLPHKKALAVSEKIGTIAREQNLPVTQVLAEISGFDIKKRSDLKQIILKALNYHPHITSSLKSFFTKVNFKVR